MNIEQWPIERVKPYHKNPRRNDAAVAACAESIDRYGFRQPIVVDAECVIVVGHTRYKAALKLGLKEVPVHVASDLTPERAREYRLADNRTAQFSEWDVPLLIDELEALPEPMPEVFEFEALVDGFDTGRREVVEDEVPDPPADPITKPGDLWLLGSHRVLCGDSTKAEDVGRVMVGEKAALCFTSPPYGQQRDYTKEGKEKVADWDGLMRGVFGNLPMAYAGQVLVNLGLIHRDGEWIPYWDGWIEWMRDQGWRRFGWYVWDQGSGLPGDWSGRLAPSHEFIFHLNKESVRPQKCFDCDSGNVAIGERATKKRRAGGNVTAMRGKDGKVKAVSSTKRNANKIPDSVIRISRCATIDMARENHPATFPIQLPAFAMRCWTGSIFDPFLGSGTTLIAAEQLNRKCYGIEISPQYCDVIVKRWELFTGRKAELAT
jgi:DNA modification methylase